MVLSISLTNSTVINISPSVKVTPNITTNGEYTIKRYVNSSTFEWPSYIAILNYIDIGFSTKYGIWTPFLGDILRRPTGFNILGTTINRYYSRDYAVSNNTNTIHVTSLLLNERHYNYELHNSVHAIIELEVASEYCDSTFYKDILSQCISLNETYCDLGSLNQFMNTNSTTSISATCIAAYQETNLQIYVTDHSQSAAIYNITEPANTYINGEVTYRLAEDINIIPEYMKNMSHSYMPGRRDYVSFTFLNTYNSQVSLDKLTGDTFRQYNNITQGNFNVNLINYNKIGKVEVQGFNYYAKSGVFFSSSLWISLLVFIILALLHYFFKKAVIPSSWTENYSKSIASSLFYDKESYSYKLDTSIFHKKITHYINGKELKFINEENKVIEITPLTINKII